jgi:hypothetical protein
LRNSRAICQSKTKVSNFKYVKIILLLGNEIAKQPRYGASTRCIEKFSCNLQNYYFSSIFLHFLGEVFTSTFRAPQRQFLLGSARTIMKKKIHQVIYEKMKKSHRTSHRRKTNRHNIDTSLSCPSLYYLAPRHWKIVCDSFHSLLLGLKYMCIVLPPNIWIFENNRRKQFYYFPIQNFAFSNQKRGVNFHKMYFSYYI